jgi:UDP-N-acetylmuramate--alanine ligase
LQLRLPGRHNLLNALAAVAVGHVLGAPLDRIARSLAAFDGVGRRFERLGEVKGIEIVDDYAHHPSEVTATLAAARQAFPGRRLIAVFQPHLYSRTAREAPAMGRALAAADLVIVTDVYAAREQPMPGISGALVAQASREAGVETLYEPDRGALGQRVLDVARSGDAILTLGAGDITRVGRELVQGLQAA